MGYIGLAPIRDNPGISFIDRMVDEVTRDCVLYLPLYKLPGGSFTSRDAHGHLCSVTGALWNPQGRTFDGTDDHVDISDNTSLRLGTNNFAILGWFKHPLITNSDNYAIISKGATASGEWFISLYSSAGQLQFYSAGITVLHVGNYDDNIWHHFAIVRSKNNGFLYADGVEVDTEDFTSINLNTTKNVSLGTREEGTAKFWNGIIGELMIYSRALSPLEIQRIYLATKGRYQ